MTYALATNGYICFWQATAAFTGERVKPSSLTVVGLPSVTACLHVPTERPPIEQPAPPPSKPQVCATVPPCSSVTTSVGDAAPAPSSSAAPLAPGPAKPTVKVSVPTVKVRKT